MRSSNLTVSSGQHGTSLRLKFMGKNMRECYDFYTKLGGRLFSRRLLLRPRLLPVMKTWEESSIVSQLLLPVNTVDRNAEYWLAVRHASWKHPQGRDRYERSV